MESPRKPGGRAGLDCGAQLTRGSVDVGASGQGHRLTGPSSPRIRANLAVKYGTARSLWTPARGAIPALRAAPERPPAEPGAHGPLQMRGQRKDDPAKLQ